MTKTIYYDRRKATFVIESYEGTTWNKKNVKVYDEPIIGQKLYCSNYNLDSIKRDFIKDQVYIIEKLSAGKTTAGKVKFKGVKGYHKLDCFSPLENNVALHRETQINEVMDGGIFSDVKVRRIDTMPNKNRVLIQLFIASFQSQIGIEGQRANAQVTYDEIITNLIKQYRKFELTNQDYENISGLTIKELVDSFVKEINID
jgi:hypothetical protein